MYFKQQSAGLKKLFHFSGKFFITSDGNPRAVKPSIKKWLQIEKLFQDIKPKGEADFQLFKMYGSF